MCNLCSVMMFRMLPKNYLSSNSARGEQLQSWRGRIYVSVFTSPCCMLDRDYFSFFHLLFKDYSLSVAYEARQSYKFMSFIQSQCFNKLTKFGLWTELLSQLPFTSHICRIESITLKLDFTLFLIPLSSLSMHLPNLSGVTSCAKQKWGAEMVMSPVIGWIIMLNSRQLCFLLRCLNIIFCLSLLCTLRQLLWSSISLKSILSARVSMFRQIQATACIFLQKLAMLYQIYTDLQEEDRLRRVELGFLIYLGNSSWSGAVSKYFPFVPLCCQLLGGLGGCWLLIGYMSESSTKQLMRQLITQLQLLAGANAQKTINFELVLEQEAAIAPSIAFQFIKRDTMSRMLINLYLRLPSINIYQLHLFLYIHLVVNHTRRAIY